MSSVVRASQLAMVLLLGLSLPAHAQSSESSAPLFNPEANSDPFSSRGDSNGTIMQMIHRAMRGDANVDRAAEAAAQRESLSEAANDFFAKRGQIKKAPASPMATPPSTGIVAPGSNLSPTTTNQLGNLKPATILPIAPVQPGAVAPSSAAPSPVTPSTVTPSSEVAPATQATEAKP